MQLPCLSRAAGVWLFFVGLLGGFPGLRAQEMAMPEADRKALTGYSLDSDKLKTVDNVAKKILVAAHYDAQIAAELRAVNAANGGAFDEVNALFDKLAPHVAEVIKSERVDVRTFLLGMISTLFAESAATADANSTEVVPGYIPAANVEFARKNAERMKDACADIKAVDVLGQPAPKGS